MNENNNRVSKAMPELIFQEILDHLDDTDSLLQTYKVGLTPDERITMPKINIDNKAFVEDASNEMQTPTAGQILPAFLKPTDILVDLNMFAQGEKIITKLNNLQQVIDDIRMVAGSEAYTTALTFKKLAEAAHNAGIPGTKSIIDKLRERFAGQGKTDAHGGENPTA